MFLRVAEFTVTRLRGRREAPVPHWTGFFICPMFVYNLMTVVRVTGFGSVVGIASNVSFLSSCILAGGVDILVYHALRHDKQREHAGHMLTGAVYHQGN